MKTVAQNAARNVRKFVRAQFGARIVKIDGEYQSKVTKDSARIIINNPAHVIAVLRELCGRPISDDGKTTAFKVKKVGVVEVTVGATNVLKLHTSDV